MLSFTNHEIGSPRLTGTCPCGEVLDVGDRAHFVVVRQPDEVRGTVIDGPFCSKDCLGLKWDTSVWQLGWAHGRGLRTMIDKILQSDRVGDRAVPRGGRRRAVYADAYILSELFDRLLP